MAYSFLLKSPTLASYHPPSPLKHKLLKPIKCPTFNTIKCCKSTDPDFESDFKRNNRSNLNFLTASITLTVISTSLPQSHALAAEATKVKKPARSKRAQEALSLQELLNWSKGLPLIADRIPYTSILEFINNYELKNVIKLANSGLRQRPESVLVVLKDNRVFKSMLPSVEGNSRFWETWDELKVDTFCVNAYSPPVKRPEIPDSYLSFLAKWSDWITGLVTKKKRPLSKRALELRRMREELQSRKSNESKKLREENEMIEKAIKTQKREEKRRRKAEERKQFEQSLLEARENNQGESLEWVELAKDRNVTTLLGFLFFYIFYRTVVLSYKKQQKDYEDRLKIEKAEAEERKKMRQLEKEMQGMVGEDDLAEVGAGDEQDPYMQMAKQFMKSGARVRRAQNRRLPQYLERGVDVKFTDVAGLGKIRLELEEIVKFFTHGEMYRRRGVKIPGGILLCGPPGVGKTLLAKAVAGEAGVNFFSISASQFVEIYVGVGASRVRALYQEAKENAPSVVFIDELDAVGRERGLIKGSGGQERDATLNQLLVCLDGFEGRGDVITIASTNRPDILDPALVRPGRFDRKIFIPKPGVIGRIEILKVHARKKPMAEEVDYMAVATMTDGMVGAELANIVEVAAINMMRDARTEITTDDLLQAAQIEERGMLDRKDRSSETWRQVAVNEAAMAVVAVNFPDLRNIEFLTISPRAGRETGYVRFKMDNIKFKEGMLSRQSLLDHVTVQLAPRAADELWYGEGQLSTIWAETADNARSAARTFVLGGLSEKHYGLSDFWSADKINDIDLEASRILHQCYENAKEILASNRKLMDAVVDQLVVKKSLTKPEFMGLVELYASIKPMPPSILEIRAAKRKALQGALLTTQKGASSNVTV